jgi:SpoVK/Ycf46/Vps4 family AAA+-type ATPase
MMDTKEKQVALYYLNNLSKKSSSKKKEEAMLSWVELNSEDLFDIDLSYKWSRHGSKRYLPRSVTSRRMLISYLTSEDTPDEKNLLNRSMMTLRSLLAEQDIVDISAKGYDKRMDTLFDVFKIDPVHQSVLRYLIYCEQLCMMDDFNSSITSDRMARTADQFGNSTIAALCLIQAHMVEELFSFDSPLVLKGILEKEDEGSVRLSYSFRKVLHTKYDTEQQIKEIMLGATATASLSRDNFKYLVNEYDYIGTVLRSAISEGKAGVNILLYGVPGTGKTELCKSIAKEAGATLYMLSENQKSNDREERIAELSLTQTLLAEDKNAAILFDEAEDAFQNESMNSFLFGPVRSRKSDSKLYFNRMLEKNKRPVIWISNNIEGIDTAYIRRFTYALEVMKPDQAAKQEIWKNICAKHEVKLPAEQIAKYAKKYDIAPSFIDTAVGAASLVKSEGAIERTIDSLQKATLGYVPRKKTDEAVKFLPELLNADANLSELAESIVKKGSLKFSLCLYGAPGTGKSAFARYLAEKMGLQVIQKRASDLISMWVGGTEKNIARAFNEAYASKSLLVFDEADSFLRSRKGAGHSWEVTQVNEMLTWMESHPYPFICTTNLMKDLDEASLRRFTFKVEYGFLKPEQVGLTFKHFFGVEAKAPLAHLTHLTPGDFAVVKNKQNILDTADAPELVRMLELEQAAKGVKTMRMGFV